MVRPAVQLPSRRDADRPLSDLLERAAAAGFEGVEFAPFAEDVDAAAVREALSRTGLPAVGAHVSIDRLGEDTEATLAFYRGLGCERFVVPGIPPERFETERAVETAAQRLDGLAVALGEYGVSVHYHGRGYEFIDLGDRTAYEYLVELTEHVGFDLDAASALATGVDPAGLVEQLDGRAPLLHATDYDRGAGERVPIGQGDLDVSALVDAHAAAGGEWIVHPFDGPMPPDSLADAVLATGGAP
jgi:sugar phosphate isomerase/epimerase